MICSKFNDCIQGNTACSYRNYCIRSSDKRKYIICEEYKKKYILVNDKSFNITCIHLDNEYIIEKDKERCDFLIIFDDLNIILVELKGSNYKQAVNQILEVIPQIQKNIKMFKAIHARIIAKPVPNVRPNNYFDLFRKIHKLNGTLQDFSSKGEENISSF